jgi:acetate kinase
MQPRLSTSSSTASVASCGFDALVFTAGIGEHAPEIRRRVYEKAGWLGVEIDEAANAAGTRGLQKATAKHQPG